MRWTPEQYEAYASKKHNGNGGCRKQYVPPVPKSMPGKMNKLEARYAQRLEELKLCGEILDWKYEPFSLRLAKDCHYRPDFLVVYQDRVEIHETKGGFARDDSIVKFKTAAEMFWWMRFVMVFWKNQQWEMREYGQTR